VDADADDVAGLDALGNDLLEGLIDEDGIAAIAAWRRQAQTAIAA
jgi:hypothetical protein